MATSLFNTPVNVSIALPASSCVPCSSGTPTGTGAPTNTGTPVTFPQCASPAVGNGIQGINNNILTVIALEAMPAYSLVVMGAGGVKAADKTNPDHKDILVGITLQESRGGQPTIVLCFGVLFSNPIVGSAGWNFVMNQPVYLGNTGAVAQSLNGVGFVKKVGFALSASVLLARVAEAEGIVQTVPDSIQDVAVNAQGNYSIKPQNGGTYRISAITTDLTLSINTEALPQNKPSTFGVMFVTDRLPHSVNASYIAAGNLTALQQFSLNPVTSEASYFAEFFYDPTAQKLVRKSTLAY